MKALFILMGLISASAWAQELPPEIRAAQALMVNQGVCQTAWEDIVETQAIELEPGYTLWIVPCALWAHNLASAAYLQIRESTRMEGYITKQIYFPSYSAFQGIFASNVIHNAEFDPETETLNGRFFLNGNSHCGSMASYAWHGGHQNFLLKRLLKQDDCKNPEAPWIKPEMP